MKSIHGKDIKIFACNSNKKLAEDIAAAMGLPLGRCTVGAFADGEVSISIEESVRGSDVFIIQSTCGPVNNNLMELLIMIDALKRASAGRITAVVPYYGSPCGTDPGLLQYPGGSPDGYPHSGPLFCRKVQEPPPRGDRRRFPRSGLRHPCA